MVYSFCSGFRLIKKSFLSSQPLIGLPYNVKIMILQKLFTWNLFLFSSKDEMK